MLMRTDPFDRQAFGTRVPGERNVLSVKAERTRTRR